LGFNLIGDKGATEIASILEDNSTLLNLDLTNNKFDQKILEKIEGFQLRNIILDKDKKIGELTLQTQEFKTKINEDTKKIEEYQQTLQQNILVIDELVKKTDLQEKKNCSI